MPENCRSLLVLTIGSTGKSASARLPAGRWWQAIGSSNPAFGYEVWVQWGSSTFLVELLPQAQASKALVAFSDAFVYVQGNPGDTVLIAVSE